MPVDCRDWRNNPSAYVQAVCKSAEYRGETVESVEERLHQAADAGMSIKSFEESGGELAPSVQQQSGGLFGGLVSGSTVGWGLGLGAIAAAYWYTKGR